MAKPTTSTKHKFRDVYRSNNKTNGTTIRDIRTQLIKAGLTTQSFVAQSWHSTVDMIALARILKCSEEIVAPKREGHFSCAQPGFVDNELQINSQLANVA
jgi:hypothetical protein